MEIKLYSAVHQYVVTSDITKENFDVVKKYNPTACQLLDEDGNVTFAVGYNEGHSSISKVGVTFGQTDGTGKLQAIGAIAPAVGQTEKDFVADAIAPAYEGLKALEEQIANAAAAATATHNDLVASIAVG